jgi:hypothetical protein
MRQRGTDGVNVLIGLSRSVTDRLHLTCPPTPSEQDRHGRQDHRDMRAHMRGSTELLLNSDQHQGVGAGPPRVRWRDGAEALESHQSAGRYTRPEYRATPNSASDRKRTGAVGVSP